MEKRRQGARLIVVAVLAVLMPVFGPRKLDWLIPELDEATTGYIIYELLSGNRAHDSAEEGLEGLHVVLDDA